jgi:murein L,D-transpeptidase YafK
MGLQPFPMAVFWRLVCIGAAIACLAACQESDIPKAQKPVPYSLTAKMQFEEMDPQSPIFIRLYKETSEFEIWKQKRNGDYALLKTYPICKWSGALGPKKVEGDRQAPEGIYIVTPAQMNPASHYYLSFNIGYPNAYDRSLGRSGSNLMVHGACSSSGCYSMSDEDAGEIFALARDSFRGGQTAFQIQALPFRMTATNLARHRDDPNMPFWRMLKVASDEFELTLRPPKVDVCDRQYVFNADGNGATFDPDAKCPPYTVAPALTAALAQKQAADDASFGQEVAKLEAAQKEAADHALAVQEEQTQPSVLDRLLGKTRTDAAPSAPADQTTPAAPVATAAVGTNVAATVPEPRLRPQTQSMPAAAEAAPASPTVGTFVRKKFVWPGDESSPPANAAPSDPSTGKSL